MIWTMCIFSWVWCLIQIFTNVSLGKGEWLIDMIYCMFSACMQSQQNAELEYQRGSKV